MLEFVDEIQPLDDRWTQWAASRRPTPVWLARVHTSDEVDRYVGAYVTPAEVVLGLRGWDDADEGLDPEPFALFDIEKLVRMMLHQSGLAFEALCAAQSLGALDVPARELARAAVTHEILSYYRDVTAVLETGNREGWRWRTLMTGALLAQQGVVSHAMPTLCRMLGAGAEPSATEVVRLRTALASSPHLPETPADYDLLNAFVVASRLASR